jgi:small multidrug resistance pump
MKRKPQYLTRLSIEGAAKGSPRGRPDASRTISREFGTMMVYYVALGIGIVAGIAGQILLKSGADSPDYVGQLLRPATICGLTLYVAAAFLYLVALRKIPVSVAFPSVSLSYAIVAVLGHFLFGEPFGIKQIGGIVLIMSGVVLINQG